MLDMRQAEKIMLPLLSCPVLLKVDDMLPSKILSSVFSCMLRNSTINFVSQLVHWLVGWLVGLSLFGQRPQRSR